MQAAANRKLIAVLVLPACLERFRETARTQMGPLAAVQGTQLWSHWTLLCRADD
jgi:hypothetical protein